MRWLVMGPLDSFKMAAGDQKCQGMIRGWNFQSYPPDLLGGMELITNG